MDGFSFTCLQPSIYLIVPRNSVQTSKIQNLLNQNYFNSNLPILKNMKYKISSKFVNKKIEIIYQRWTDGSNFFNFSIYFRRIILFKLIDSFAIFVETSSVSDLVRLTK